jgi:hypothetical protein
MTNLDGSTQVDVKLSYNPSGGDLSHGVASLLAAHPKRAMALAQVAAGGRERPLPIGVLSILEDLMTAPADRSLAGG